MQIKILTQMQSYSDFEPNFWGRNNTFQLNQNPIWSI